MKKPTLFILFIAGIIFTLSMLQIIASNTLSTKGVLLGKLEDEVEQYKKENTFLKEKVLAMSSFTRIASSAGELGLDTQTAKIYLHTPISVALRQ